MKIKVIVLEANSGNFQGNDWKSLICRVDGKLMKFKVQKDVNIDGLLDKEVELECDVFGTVSQHAYLKVVAIS